MPMVIKRDETGKNPKTTKAADPGAAKAAKAPKAPKAASASTKPAAAGTAKKKAADGAPNETMKIVGLVLVVVVALGLVVWYFTGGGSPTPVDNSANPTPVTGGTVTGAGPGGKAGGITTQDGVPNLGKSLGGSEGEDSTGAGDGNKTQREGID
jgi:hypothetical protein